MIRRPGSDDPALPDAEGLAARAEALEEDLHAARTAFATELGKTVQGRDGTSPVDRFMGSRLGHGPLSPNARTLLALEERIRNLLTEVGMLASDATDLMQALVKGKGVRDLDLLMPILDVKGRLQGLADEFDRPLQDPWVREYVPAPASARAVLDSVVGRPRVVGTDQTPQRPEPLSIEIDGRITMLFGDGRGTWIEDANGERLDLVTSTPSVWFLRSERTDGDSNGLRWVALTWETPLSSGTLTELSVDKKAWPIASRGGDPTHCIVDRDEISLIYPSGFAFTTQHHVGFVDVAQPEKPEWRVLGEGQYVPAYEASPRYCYGSLANHKGVHRATLEDVEHDADVSTPIWILERDATGPEGMLLVDAKASVYRFEGEVSDHRYLFSGYGNAEDPAVLVELLDGAPVRVAIPPDGPARCRGDVVREIRAGHIYNRASIQAGDPPTSMSLLEGLRGPVELLDASGQVPIAPVIPFHLPVIEAPHLAVQSAGSQEFYRVDVELPEGWLAHKGQDHVIVERDGRIREGLLGSTIIVQEGCAYTVVARSGECLVAADGRGVEQAFILREDRVYPVTLRVPVVAIPADGLSPSRTVFDGKVWQGVARSFDEPFAAWDPASGQQALFHVSDEGLAVVEGEHPEFRVLVDGSMYWIAIGPETREQFAARVVRGLAPGEPSGHVVVAIFDRIRSSIAEGECSVEDVRRAIEEGQPGDTAFGRGARRVTLAQLERSAGYLNDLPFTLVVDPEGQGPRDRATFRSPLRAAFTGDARRIKVLDRTGHPSTASAMAQYFDERVPSTSALASLNCPEVSAKLERRDQDRPPDILKWGWAGGVHYVPILGGAIDDRPHTERVLRAVEDRAGELTPKLLRGMRELQLVSRLEPWMMRYQNGTVRISKFEEFNLRAISSIDHELIHGQTLVDREVQVLTAIALKLGPAPDDDYADSSIEEVLPVHWQRLCENPAIAGKNPYLDRLVVALAFDPDFGSMPILDELKENDLAASSGG